ncbi:MAG TPA: fimbria/pilus outer membrane usher protein [Rectinemataceae bacterium]|nr:fimbria/pilus outer membrane usher protein [Rectinemataceae bacterium]
MNPVPEGEAIVALNINGRRYGDVDAKIDMEDPFIKVSILREALSPALAATQQNRIFDIILSKLEWAGIADLEAAGLKGTWDMETLSYSIVTPGEYSSLRELDFSPNAFLEDKRWLAPASIAGIINFSASGTATIKATGSILPISVNVDGLLNLWSLAIESSGSVSYLDPSFTWSLNSARAVYDFPKIEGRLFAGMISGEGTARQSRPEIYGVSLHNVENFSRYDRDYAPSVAFTLQKPSTVRFKINGSVIRNMKLDRGNYRIYDLPFAYGLNQFELEVQDGETSDGIALYKPVTKYITAETGLLVGGKWDYGLSAGVGRTELDQPIASVYFRYGLASALTLAANLQADRRSLLAGFGTVLGTDIGGFILGANSLFAWDGRSNPFAFSADMEYHYANPGKKSSPTFGLSFSYASEGFTAPQPLSTVILPEAYMNASASVGGAISKNISFGLSGQWNRTLTGTISDKGVASLNIGFSTARNVSFSVSSGMEFTTNKSPALTASFSLTASDPHKSGRQIGLAQSAEGGNTVTYSDVYPVLGGVGFGIQGTNLAGGVNDPSSLSINSGFSTSTFSLSGSGGISYGSTLASPTGSVNLSLATALVFADGSIAISKPLYDSFIIFDPDKSTGDMSVAFAIDSGTKLMSHGMPVASPLSSYHQSRASMDFPEADADVSATIPQIALSTGYRTGFLFRAGLEKRFYLTGRLVDSAGTPIAYTAGDVEKSDGTFSDQTFTDDAGFFQIYGLTSGEYKILWPDTIGTTVLTLADAPSGTLELGDVVAAIGSGK